MCCKSFLDETCDRVNALMRQARLDVIQNMKDLLATYDEYLESAVRDGATGAVARLTSKIADLKEEIRCREASL